MSGASIIIGVKISNNQAEKQRNATEKATNLRENNFAMKFVKAQGM